jgi:hypothetical protein
MFKLRPGGTTRGKRSIIGWEGQGEGCGYLRLQGYSPTCVNCGPFVVDHWTSIWLCTDHMLDLWDPVNRRSSMIIVVGRYPTIPLEISIRIVYMPPMDSLMCGIVWRTCTKERWDLDWSYDIVVKDWHAWSICGRAYVMLVRFIPLLDWLLIRISVTLLDMSDSLFTIPLIEMHVYYYDDSLRWLINDDDYYIMMLYLLHSYACLLECSSFTLHIFIHV